ncbi:hypothetical protein [Nocardia seriolae]|uniref:hypothetical protein n=1 Tax=Nocardia seriolae TaxID=37332 RepID=UPI00288C47F2|nr:hypothetical protein [Nocardia seriolae]WNJ59136.1 hypothetical protein RMO66_38425 [Nocardia seriolae]
MAELMLRKRTPNTLTGMRCCQKLVAWINMPCRGCRKALLQSLIGELHHRVIPAYYRGVVEYVWSPTAKQFLQRFQVRTWEVMEVLYSSHRWPRPARTDQDLSVLTVWGRSDEGRPLVVMLPSPSARWEILMAVPMGPHQLTEYNAWEANQ